MSKNIIVCCDGTGNEYGERNTNVVKLYQAIVHNPSQITYYDPGVGTIGAFGRRLGGLAGNALGKAFGAGLQRNVEEIYRYLMDRFQPGDRLFLFGFSRGAYTVRALAGLLHRVGLLHEGNINHIPYVSKIYFNQNKHYLALGFKKTYCRDCKPYFIGVWDTVGSMGLFWGRKFFDTTLNEDIAFGYHAVSIDEQRKKFPVSLWNEEEKASHQTMEQVWFPGVHSDIGGSYSQTGLSDITLKWMLKKAKAQGLMLKPKWRNHIEPRFSPNPRGVIHESRTRQWRLWEPAPRIIPSDARIHVSVCIRQKHCGYDVEFPKKYSIVR